MRVAIVAIFAVAAGAPGQAGAAGNKVKFEALKVKRGGIGRGQIKPAPKVGRGARVKNFFARRLSGLRPINRKQHAFAPMKPGDVRVFDIISSNGESTNTSMMTQRVSDVRLQDGRLRAQVAQTWESDGHSSTTHHVQDVSQDGMLMATAEKLDESPATPVQVEGVGLPRKLSPGKTWTNRMSYQVEGSSVETHTSGRVLGKVRRAGPDRKLHDGVEIETVTHTTTTIDGTPHRTTLVQRSVFLKGLGEVESTSHTPGKAGSVTRRLVGFTPGSELR